MISAMSLSSSSKLILSVTAALALFGAGCGAPTPATPAATEAPATNEAPSTGTEPSNVVQQSATVLPSPTNTAPTPTQPATKPTPKTTTKTAPALRTSTVTIVNMAFSPQILAVTTGDTVVWSNKDTRSHTTVSDNALIWDSGNISPNAGYKRVFSAPGSYTYHCGIHPSMVGTIIVRDAVK